jgi:hypothetical protein
MWVDLRSGKARAQERMSCDRGRRAGQQAPEAVAAVAGQFDPWYRRHAGVYVSAGGLEDQPASIVATGGAVTDGPHPQAIGGFTLLDVPSREEALRWAAKIAVACRSARAGPALAAAWQRGPARRPEPGTRGSASWTGREARSSRLTGPPQPLTARWSDSQARRGGCPRSPAEPKRWQGRWLRE